MDLMMRWWKNSQYPVRSLRSSARMPEFPVSARSGLQTRCAGRQVCALISVVQSAFEFSGSCRSPSQTGHLAWDVSRPMLLRRMRRPWIRPLPARRPSCFSPFTPVIPMLPPVHMGSFPVANVEGVVLGHAEGAREYGVRLVEGGFDDGLRYGGDPCRKQVTARLALDSDLRNRFYWGRRRPPT